MKIQSAVFLAALLAIPAHVMATGSNDTVAGATVISVGKDQGVSVNGFDDPIDILVAQVSPGKDYEVRLEVLSQTGDADLWVYDGFGTLLGSSEKPSKKIDAVTFAATTSSVYVKVAAYKDSSVEARLTFRAYDYKAAAMTFLNGAAAVIVAGAYPTADYHHVELRQNGVSRTSDGFVVRPRFYFHSGWTGDLLYFDLDFYVTNDFDVQRIDIGSFNGNWPPFASSYLVKTLVDEL